MFQEQVELVSSAAANSSSSKGGGEKDDVDRDPGSVVLAREKETEEKYHAEIEALRKENEERSLRLLEEKEVEIARLREETSKKERELQEELEDKLQREVIASKVNARASSAGRGDRTPPGSRKNGASSTSTRTSNAGRKNGSSTSTTPRKNGSDTENKTRGIPRTIKVDEEKTSPRAKVDTGLEKNNDTDRARS